MAVPSERAQSGSPEPVLLRRDDTGVATLTMNRPAQRNALSRELLDALHDQLDDIAADPAVKVVVIAASGPVFCAGHDMHELRADPTLDHYQATFAHSGRLMKAIVRLPKPVIAQVQGMATAAGVQIVASCDLAVATEEARFATPGVQIGLFCSTPMVALTRNIGRKRAMEMLLTGEAIDAATAVAFGLINRAVPATELEAAVAELARKIADKSPYTIALGIEAFYRQIELDLDSAYDYATEVMAKNMLARDAEEGIDAFLQKRRPVWEGR